MVERQNNHGRRSVLKGAAGLLAGSAVVGRVGAEARSADGFDPHSADDVTRFMEEMNGIQTADQERAVQSLSDTQQEALADASIPLYSESVTESVLPRYSNEEYVVFVRERTRSRTEGTPEPSELAEKWGWRGPDIELGEETQYYYKSRSDLSEYQQSASASDLCGDENSGSSQTSHIEQASSYLTDIKLFRWQLNLNWDYSYCRNDVNYQVYNKSATNPNIYDRVVSTSDPWKFGRSISENTSSRSEEVEGFKQVQFVASDLGGALPLPDTSANPRITLQGNWYGRGELVSSSSGI